jgi:hypothetical protein
MRGKQMQPPSVEAVEISSKTNYTEFIIYNAGDAGSD